MLVPQFESFSMKAEKLTNVIPYASQRVLVHGSRNYVLSLEMRELMKRFGSLRALSAMEFVDCPKEILHDIN